MLNLPSTCTPLIEDDAVIGAVSGRAAAVVEIVDTCNAEAGSGCALSAYPRRDRLKPEIGAE